MHIKSITIKNFRNFTDFNIEFTDGFQTIIGENNIGKSNLFWAIRLILDKNLSYNYRNLEEKDFNGFVGLDLDSFILISIEFFGENLDGFPNLHALKTSKETIRITYLYAHKSKFIVSDEEFENIIVKDFQWRLFGGGNSLDIDGLINLSQISFKDLEGINLYHITGFRNINAELFGNSKSLLNQYCQSRENSENEQNDVKTILSDSSDELNKLGFISEIAEKVKEKNSEIAGKHFTFPVSLGFLTNNDADVWSQLNLFFNPKEGKEIPLTVLGLGQKNLLYLSLFCILFKFPGIWSD